VTGLHLPKWLKALVRLIAAFFGAIVGSLAGSVQVCAGAADDAAWPRWADFLCAHNVWVFWLLSAPILFTLILLLLGKHFAPFRHHAVVALLAVYGLYGLFTLSGNHTWRTMIVPAAALVAAVGVAVRQRWARYLVYVIALLLAVQWSYFVWTAAISGYFRDSGVGRSILSLLPGAAFLLLVTFCCYGVTTQRASERGPGSSSRA
jgi:hypothetical protein